MNRSVSNNISTVSEDQGQGLRPVQPVRITEQVWPEGITPVVSICSITYNHGKFIRECLDGFLTQETTFPVEVLIHDDASTDGTADIIREYESQYPHIIKSIYQTENQYSKGAKPNIDFNFPRAKGKYIALCEGDDYWTDPNKLQRQLDFLEANEEYVLCFHAVVLLTNEGFIEDQMPVPGETTTALDLCRYNYIQTCSCVFRNRLSSKFPNAMYKSPAGDYVLHLLNAQYGKIKHLDKKMAVYRMHEGGLWSSKTPIEKTLGSAEVYKALIEHFDGEIKAALTASYRELMTRELKKYSAENDRLRRAFESGINNPYYMMDNYEFKTIIKGFILKLLIKYGLYK